MPYKQAKSQFWWVAYTDAGGARVRRSTGTKDIAEARALEAKWKLEAHNQKHWDQSPSYTFDELMLKYLREKRGRASTPRDHGITKRLKAFFGGSALAELTADDIARYKAERAAVVSQGTIIKELGLFSAALNHARREWDWRVENVVAKRIPAQPEGRLRWLTVEEATGLLAVAEKNKRALWLAPFIRLGIQTGMRRGELLGLEWKRVDLASRLIYLDPADQKSRRSGSVPLNDAAVAALGALRALKTRHPRWVFARRGKRIASIKKAFAKACADSGVADCTPHTLRHTCAAWLIQAGVPLRTVSATLRHRDIRTTIRYAHLAPESTREAVAALPAV